MQSTTHGTHLLVALRQGFEHSGTSIWGESPLNEILFLVAQPLDFGTFARGNTVITSNSYLANMFALLSVVGDRYLNNPETTIPN